MDITGIPPHTTLLAKIERLKCIIEYFKVSVTGDMKGGLKDYLNVRNINGLGFVQSNLSLSKLDETINHNKVISNQITGEREEQVLHLVEDIVSSEYKIMIFL